MKNLQQDKNLPLAIVISGTTVSLGVVRALGKQGVPVVVVHYEDSDIACFSRYAISRERVPHPEHSEEQFMEALIKHIQDYDAKIVFPVSDQAVLTVSRYRDLLGQYCKVACTDSSTANTFIDKKNTYQLAEENGVSAPRTLVPTSIEDVKRFCVEAEFPCLLKPSQSHLFVKHFDDLISAYLRSSELGLDVLIQEIIPGPDSYVVNYNAFYINGAPIVEATAVHYRNGPPHWGSPRVAQSQHVAEVIQPGRRILKAVDYNGFACTEFKFDARDRLYKLMEVNVRHNMSTLLSVRSGVNFPWLEYNYVLHGDVPRQPETEENVFWIDLIRDIGHSLKNARSEGITLPLFLKPYTAKHTFAIWDLRDPRPFLKRLATVVSTGFKSVSSGH
jgi:predicted ATP-grasp superfamily ATP-dependent carboligase